MASPITFDPSVVEIFLSFAICASLVILPHSIKASPLLLATHLRQARVTVLMLTPSLYRRFTPESLKILWEHSVIEVLCFGGESMHKDFCLFVNAASEL